MENRIRKFRLERGWKQGELAEKIDFSLPTISEWERGGNLSWLERLFFVCEILEAPLEEVFRPFEVEGRIEVENRIAFFRKRKGYSLQDVATVMGISRQSFWSFEKGLKAGGYGSLPKIYELARVLEVSVEELFPGRAGG